MDDDQLTALAGAFVVVVFVGLLAAAWYLQRPLTDRTVILFAALLYATLQIDISSVLPVNIVPEQSSHTDTDTDDASGTDTDDTERE